MRVLIVEDEALLVDLLAALVEEAGGTVAAMTDTAEEALTTAERERPDLALVDVKLAGPMDGVDAARALSQAGVMLIFVTGSNDAATVARMQALTPLGICHKPFRNESLLRLLAQAADRIRAKNE